MKERIKLIILKTYFKIFKNNFSLKSKEYAPF